MSAAGAELPEAMPAEPCLLDHKLFTKMVINIQDLDLPRVQAV